MRNAGTQLRSWNAALIPSKGILFGAIIPAIDAFGYTQKKTQQKAGTGIRTNLQTAVRALPRISDITLMTKPPIRQAICVLDTDSVCLDAASGSSRAKLMYVLAYFAPQGTGFPCLKSNRASNFVIRLFFGKLYF